MTKFAILSSSTKDTFLENLEVFVNGLHHASKVKFSTCMEGGTVIYSALIEWNDTTGMETKRES